MQITLYSNFSKKINSTEIDEVDQLADKAYVINL